MKKVLVVDDSEIILIRIRNSLEEIGCQVITAASGVDGVNAAKNDNDISLIIADINMPGMNGIEMCEKIRGLPQHKDTMIMMCTTESSSKLKERAKELGVKCWLIKPINDDLLKKGVNLLYEKMAK
jgi:two-component system chemotaxis response regulator CheY